MTKSKDIIVIEDLHKHFGKVKALNGVNLTVERGKVVVAIGPSGSGKSTMLRCINHLEEVSGGILHVDGEFVGYDLRNGKLYEVRNSLLCKRRAGIGMVFQSFNLFSHMTALENLIEAPIMVKGVPTKEAKDQAYTLLERVGLEDKADAYPRQLSGGQQQRVAIARALAMNPKMIILDEPVSALDVSVQAQILNLLSDLQDELDLTMMFIAHDLSVVRHVSSRVAVMYLGKMMELASSAELYQNPLHPYTKALLSAVPITDPVVERSRERIILTGDVPSPLRPPPGCVFNTRCPIAIDVCYEQIPEWREVSTEHWVACHRV